MVASAALHRGQRRGVAPCIPDDLVKEVGPPHEEPELDDTAKDSEEHRHDKRELNERLSAGSFLK